MIMTHLRFMQADEVQRKHAKKKDGSAAGVGVEGCGCGHERCQRLQRPRFARRDRHVQPAENDGQGEHQRKNSIQRKAYRKKCTDLSGDGAGEQQSDHVRKTKLNLRRRECSDDDD